MRPGTQTPIRNRLKDEQQKPDFPQNKARGTLMCRDCRRDVPVGEITGGQTHQICRECAREKDRRIREHQRRVEQEGN